MKNEFWVKTVVTGLGAGYMPVVSGTAGSFLGFLIFLAVKQHFYIYGVLLILFLFLGFIFVSQAEAIFKKKDDKRIVVDEIFGILFCLWGIIFKDIIWAVAGFFLFRLLDIIKPFPARRFEKLKGASGVMLDDFIAALYTNLILRGILKLTS